MADQDDSKTSAEHAAHNWKERWLAQGHQGGLEGGGQGEVRLVHRSDGRDGTTYFLKILRHQNDPERRRRMYREMAAYQTLEHTRIPKLVESNANKYADLTFKLYMVTEYIPGVTLSEYISRHGVMPVDNCLVMITRILEALQYCHEREWIHRDVKPDNIILRNGLAPEPMLVDFGLSFNGSEEDDSKTPTLEELGNRFLRLPELSSGSLMKRDPRSDVTFCAGALFYTLTGIMPSVLLDESRRLPHQRHAAAEILSNRVATRQLNRLLAIFDRSFDMDLTRRWQSADELKSAIERLNESAPTPEDEIALLRREMDEYQSSLLAKNAEVNAKLLGLGIEALNRAAGKLQPRLGALFGMSQTGFDRDPINGWATTSFGVQRAGQQMDNWVKFTIEIIGSEVVVDAESGGRRETIHRTAADQPLFGSTFDSAVELQLLRQLQSNLALAKPANQ